MDFLDTGTLQASTAAAALDTGVRQSSSYGELDTGTLQASTYYAELDTGVLQASTALAASLFNTIVIPNPALWATITSGNASQLVLPVVKFGLVLYNSGVATDLTPYILDMTLTRVLGGKTTMSTTLLQHSPGGFDLNGYPLPDLFSHMRVKKSDFNPLYLGRNAMTNKILSHRYDRTRTAVVTLTLEQPEGPQIYRYPTFLMGTPVLEESGELSWSGEGILTLLEKEGVYRSDIVPGDNILEYAHATIRTICSEKGITSLTLGFPDYPLRQLRMSSGTARKWVEEAAEPYQAHVVEQGDGLAFIPIKQPYEAPRWAHVDYLNIMGLRVEQVEGWKNKFVLSRLQDQSSVVSPDNEPQVCLGNQCVGEQIVQVTPPSNYVVIFVKRRGNAQLAFNSFQYFDEQGNAFGPPSQAQSFASAQKIGSIKFVSQTFFFGGTQAGSQQASMGTSTLSGNTSNDPNALAQYVPEYEWVIFGGSEASSQAGGDPIDEFNLAFSFALQDPATVALWGEIPEGENLEISTIPNAEVAQAAIGALLWENIRRIFRCTWKTPYVNPWAEPAHVHSITHFETDQSVLSWVQEKDTISLSRDGAVVQNFETYRGLV